MTSAPAVVAERVTVRRDGRTILDRASLEVPGGGLVGLVGPSGSGKTTLLRTIAGLVAPDDGRVLLDGIDVTAVPAHRRNIGLLPQDLALFPHLDVAGNVEFGLRMRKVPDRSRRVAELLELVGLPGTGARSVTSLSGGERQRIALARSLAPAPRALVLDEPFSALDAQRREQLAADVGRLLRELGITAVIVTHDRNDLVLAGATTVDIATVTGT